MKTMMLATAALLGIGMGSSYAGEGEGVVPNTWFTELPGVVQQAPVQRAPSALATTQYGTPTAAYMTNSRNSVYLFPPNPNQGNGS